MHVTYELRTYDSKKSPIVEGLQFYFNTIPYRFVRDNLRNHSNCYTILDDWKRP